MRAPSLVVTIAVTLAACGGGDDEPVADDDDVHFAQAMIGHSWQAVEMAEIALDTSIGAGPDVVALATTIRDTQIAEIDVMTGWLEAWGEPVTLDTSDAHDMSGAGTLTPEDMNDLGAATGPGFDAAWLAMMIGHHRGAISMAEEVQSDGVDPAVGELARAIIVAQSAEIELMQGLLED